MLGGAANDVIYWGKLPRTRKKPATAKGKGKAPVPCCVASTCSWRPPRGVDRTGATCPAESTTKPHLPWASTCKLRRPLGSALPLGGSLSEGCVRGERIEERLRASEAVRGETAPAVVRGAALSLSFQDPSAAIPPGFFPVSGPCRRIRGSWLHNEGRGRADGRRGEAARAAAGAAAGRALHRLELLFLVLREQRLEPRVDLLLNLLQTLPLPGGELQRVLLRRREDLARLRRIAGTGTGPPAEDRTGRRRS